jgi:hypothetical protein
MLPSMNVTAPVGVVVSEVTMAVKVTVWPLNDGFTDDFTVVALVVWVTVCDRAADVLFAVSESPLYVALIDNNPAGSVFVVAVTSPVLLTVPDASHVVPLLKTTVPVGAEAAVEVTVAVNVTAWP